MLTWRNFEEGEERRRKRRISPLKLQLDPG
jgi:hypothetical protein